MPDPLPSKPPPAPAARPPWSTWLMLALVLGGMWVWQFLGRDQRESPAIPYSAFYSLAEEGKIASVTLSGQTISGRLKEPEQIDQRPVHDFRTTAPSQPDPALLPLLRDKKVDIQVKSEEQPF